MGERDIIERPKWDVFGILSGMSAERTAMEFSISTGICNTRVLATINADVTNSG